MWFLLFFGLAAAGDPPELPSVEVTAQQNYQIGDLPVPVQIRILDGEGALLEARDTEVQVAGTVTESIKLRNGEASLAVTPNSGEVAVTALGRPAQKINLGVRQLPGWVSILPPIVAIFAAVLFREALLALFGGIWVGALFIYGFNPLTAFLRTLDIHLLGQITDKSHAAIIMFTMALGGMSAVMSRSGGTHALVAWLSKKAKSRRAGMLSGYAAGLAIFFDDYANCMLVGSTLRPFTDKLKISREKLAYIVDSTAAPIATVALISTWVGYQLTLFEKFVPEDRSAYDLFLDILPYSFYSFFTIAFVFFIAFTQRDFGPMLEAERRAARGDGLFRKGAQPLTSSETLDLAPPEGLKLYSFNALFPLFWVIFAVAVGMYTSGLSASPSGASLREVISEADPNAVLLWAAFGGSLGSVISARFTKALSISEALEAWVTGIKSMAMAVLILVLAWTIGSICQDYLYTGPWIMSQFSPSPEFLPVLTFFVCGVVAFATGSSFSTMAIVAPVAVPLAWAIEAKLGISLAQLDGIRHATLAALLSGAVFGDHCSPISDTTVMSSMASAADHIDHVRTQAPYALCCAGVAAGIGFIPAGFGFPVWGSLAAGVIILAFVVLRFGRTVDTSI